MTETTVSPAIEKLVLHWGEMASRWGISRTAAQIHALLYFSGKQLTADDLVGALGVARSHVSTSLRQLQTWGVVNVVHQLGERRDRFESIKDVWQVFEVLLDERKRREMDPTLKALRETAAQMGGASGEAGETKERIKQMLEFFEVMDAWYGEVRRLPLPARAKLVRWGGKLQRWLQ
jgi:DNA-binding transcriptional regulator GbsR (MarR family)